MANFMEGAFIPKAGENISPESAKIINAKIKAENKEIGIVELDPEMVEIMGNMTFEELEAVAIMAESLMDKIKGREAN